ncbi:hypothetical protein AB6A40_009089 [Gnathostoma spinigerum]|uniref:Uncharacterized protein n=1 Tax=Gnathostoma spinigerum TaxID=75299 RepID=A0ABD6F0X9_9BILA
MAFSMHSCRGSTHKSSRRRRLYSYRTRRRQRKNASEASSYNGSLPTASYTLASPGALSNLPVRRSQRVYPQALCVFGANSQTSNQNYLQRSPQRGRIQNQNAGHIRRRHREMGDAGVGERSTVVTTEMEVDEQNWSANAEASQSEGSSSNPILEECQFPGYAYDFCTRRYYRIQPVSAGSEMGFRRSDILRGRREREHKALFKCNRSQLLCPNSSAQHTRNCLNNLLQKRELGYFGKIQSPAEYRLLSENRLMNFTTVPTYTKEVLPNHIDRLAGCQFLDVSKDGRVILGCWAISNWSLQGDSRRTSSRVMCLNVKSSSDAIRKAGLQDDGVRNYPSKELSGHYGLEFETTPNLIYVLDPNLVDMVTAPVDSDVTCVLYVTASSVSNLRRKTTTYCRIFVEPIPELSNEEGADEMNSPIYNIRWTTCEDEVWSCAWNSNKMRIGLGMEENLMIVDVVSEQNFRISSRKRNVLSQEFSQDGELLYMGLRGADMVCSDLRLRSHHIVATFENSNSVGWIRKLRSHPNLLLSENFFGELKLWDVRSRRTLMTFKGHKNSHYRLPCFVDCNEKFVFAVGEDGTARGWSLHSGNLLCAVPSPRPIEHRTDFPRVVFSESWGGRAGNSAIVLAVGGDLRVHELVL